MQSVWNFMRTHRVSVVCNSILYGAIGFYHAPVLSTNFFVRSKSNPNRTIAIGLDNSRLMCRYLKVKVTNRIDTGSIVISNNNKVTVFRGLCNYLP